MSYWLSWVWPKTIATHKSDFNGDIKVIRFLGKIEITADGLTQSGGLVQKIWDEVLRELVGSRDKSLNNALILGFGAGTLSISLRRIWPKLKITGIEIDPVMIDLGKKYFGLKVERGLRIIVADVFSWMDKRRMKTPKYDLIVVDLYKGKEIPRKLYSLKVQRKIKTMLRKDGVLVTNHTLLRGQKKDALKLESMLKKLYGDVERIKTVANWVFVVEK